MVPNETNRKCSIPVLTHSINVYDVNIISNHDKELKAKALSLINVWYIGDHGQCLWFLC